MKVFKRLLLFPFVLLFNVVNCVTFAGVISLLWLINSTYDHDVAMKTIVESFECIRR